MSKKGKDWLAAKIKEGNRLWHEPKTTRFSFVREAGHLRQPHYSRTDYEMLFGNDSEARDHLRAADAIELLSIRFQVADMRRRGQTVETWIRGSYLRRLIERRKPNREGISHDRYSIIMIFLQHRQLAEPDGRNGYQWREAFHRLPQRADWLLNLVRREGELRHLASQQRYMVLD